eukprot:TRINITY_DN10541_c0_g2_i1.p1 TRINITY_DN10541_c0_g2~~TRINITY_DN10541_c0_g2_i1.p1  ORF type:complete len:371 (+),score=53.25 TRINITY_DN10541_c0_g2_i1:779-1891(+)
MSKFLTSLHGIVRKKAAARRIVGVVKKRLYQYAAAISDFENPEKILGDNSLTERLQRLKTALQDNENSSVCYNLQSIAKSPPHNTQELSIDPHFSFERYLQDSNSSAKASQNPYCGRIVKNRSGNTMTTRTACVRDKENESFAVKVADSVTARINTSSTTQRSNMINAMNKVWNAGSSRRLIQRVNTVNVTERVDNNLKHKIAKTNNSMKSRCMNISTEHVKKRNYAWKEVNTECTSATNSKRTQNTSVNHAKNKAMERSNSVYPKSTANKIEHSNSIHNEARKDNSICLRDIMNRLENREPTINKLTVNLRTTKVDKRNNRVQVVSNAESTQEKLKRLQRELMNEKLKQNKLLQTKMRLQSKLINTFIK